jgi:hypothetical protein
MRFIVRSVIARRAFHGRWLAAALLALLLSAGGTSRALAAPGDGPCTVLPATVSNITPTLVTLRSASDDATNPISAHVGLHHPLIIRDPGGDATARVSQRAVSGLDQTVLGENIGFLLPATNIAGEFEVLTLTGEGTSDCTSGVSGVYDGLAIGQDQPLQLAADATAPLTVTIRGASKGLPLRASTTVTLSTTRGEFVAVNGATVSPTKLVQLTLTASEPIEGAAVGTVAWRPAADERAGTATMTATALQDGVSLFKTMTGSIAPPAVALDAGFAGTLPGAGQTALMVTTRPFVTVDLAAALEAAGCKPLSLAVLDAGAWEVFVPGAPGPINEGFDRSLPADTPFVVRCA